MITVKAQDGKFFFSSFLNLTSGQETQLEETELTLPDLKSLKVAIRTERLETSAEDELKVDAAITAKQPGTGGGVDPSVLDAKEDKVNKVQIIGAGSAVSYPSTTAIKTYFNTELTGLNLGQYATTAATDTKLSSKVDKVSGKDLSTNDFTNTYKTKLDGIDATIDGKITTAIENLPPATGKKVIVEPLEGFDVYIDKSEDTDSVTYQIGVPSAEEQAIKTPSDIYTSDTIQVVPLYSLTDKGEYVLTKPDMWFSYLNSQYVMPMYHLGNISNQYARGIVSADIYADPEFLTIDYDHNITKVIDDYVLKLRIGERLFTNREIAATFTSSVNGEQVIGQIKIPLSTMQGGETIGAYLARLKEENLPPEYTFELKSENKYTVPTYQKEFRKVVQE